MDFKLKKIMNVEHKNSKTESNVCSYCEHQYPEMTRRFKEIQEYQYKLFCEKVLDYGIENITVGTQLSTDEDIQISLTGLWFRTMDKFNRLKNLVLRNREPLVKNESIRDTYVDASNYCIISLLVQEKTFGK